MNEPEEAFGLDKNARLMAERAESEEKARPEPLDPPFPYRVIEFNPLMVTGS